MNTKIKGRPFRCLLWICLLAYMASLSMAADSYSILHNFAGSEEEFYPEGALTPSGNTLHGVTSKGGSNSAGTIFQINAHVAQSISVETTIAVSSWEQKEPVLTVQHPHDKK